ncbi:hypothetical protein MRX96_022070 [Rhipicephalus microplus]
MVQLFAWALLFLTIACPEAHEKQEKVPNGNSKCEYLHLNTPAGSKQVGCTWHCMHKTGGSAVVTSGEKPDECITVTPAGFYSMKCGVNYTCKLGLCDTGNKCQSSNLLVGCWKEPSPGIPHAHVQSFGCP